MKIFTAMTSTGLIPVLAVSRTGVISRIMPLLNHQKITTVDSFMFVGTDSRGLKILLFSLVFDFVFFPKPALNHTSNLQFVEH